MWRKEDGNPQASPEVSPSSTNSTSSGRVGTSAISTHPVSPKAPACVSQGIKIKGDVTGTEDLFVDGTVEGKINLTNSTLTVGPNATVKAEISARELIVRGRAEGAFTTTDRMQIWQSARVHGDIRCGSISIEDGAELRGKVEAGKAVSHGTAGLAGTSGKKPDGNKTKETNPNDANTASGAASAGAD